MLDERENPLAESADEQVNEVPESPDAIAAGLEPSPRRRSPAPKHMAEVREQPTDATEKAVAKDGAPIEVPAQEQSTRQPGEPMEAEPDSPQPETQPEPKPEAPQPRDSSIPKDEELQSRDKSGINSEAPQPEQPAPQRASEQAEIATSELPLSSRHNGLPPTEPRPVVSLHNPTMSFKVNRFAKPLFFIGIFLLLVIAVISFFLFAGAKRRHDPVVVSVNLVAPGYNSQTDSPFPLKINGADDDEGLVDEVRYVSPDNCELSLVPGTYVLTVPASPLLENGTLYVVSGVKADLSVSDEEPSQGTTLTFGVASVDQMTDAAIEEARTYASRSGVSPARVAALADATYEHRASLLPANYSFTIENIWPEDNDTYDLSLRKGEFTYPVITCSKKNEAVDELNAELREDAEEAAASYEGTLSFLSAATTSFTQEPTYFAGGIIALRCERVSYDAFSDQVKVTSKVVDLDEDQELDCWDVVGVSKTTLNSYAVSALEAYVSNTQSTSSSNTGDWLTFLFQTARTPKEIAQSAVSGLRVSYWLSEDGVVAWVEANALKNNSEPVEVLVCDFGGNPVADGVAYQRDELSNNQMTGKDPLRM